MAKKFFKDRSIEKRVMAVVRDAIDEAQREHDEEVERAEEALQASLKAAQDAHEAKLLTIVEDGVKKVFARLKA